MAIAFNLAIGGGGGPTNRNDFIFEAGIPFTLLFGDLVRFTAQPYLQVYSDKNCPSYDDIKADSSGNGALNQTDTYKAEQGACEARDGMTGANGAMLPVPNHPVPVLSQDPAHSLLRARASCCRQCLEIAVAESVNIFVIFEGDAIGQRQSLTGKFSSVFPNTDPQIYGRLGLTFKF